MTIRKAIAGGALVALVGLSGLVGYWFVQRSGRLSHAHPMALEALRSTSEVRVTDDRWVVFEPTTTTPRTALVFYPGGECDERGYAELLRAIAAEGFLVVLVPMPLQLAVLAPDRAEAVVAAFPDIRKWAIAGHSLGGAMAARFVHRHPGVMNGLLLWDAYPPAGDDLAERKLEVRTIHRADESGAMPDHYRQYLPLLPGHADFRALPGGTHINFGRFIPAPRFRSAEPPALSIDEQHALIVSYTVEFLDRLRASER